MALSNELLSQFAKVTKDDAKSKSEQTLFGTIVEYNGAKYMKIDGSDLLTPISSTTNVEKDERVTAVIKNHTLIVTGNLSSPAARTEEVEKIGTKISEFEVIVADKVSTSELEAESARIDTLVSDNVIIRGELTANAADITELKADNVTINDKLSATEGYIQDLEAENVEITGRLDAADADIDSLQADNVVIKNTLVANEAAIGELEAKNVEINGRLEANDAEIENLNTSKLSATDADLIYANIDFTNIGKAAMEHFYANSGLIKNVVVGDQTITGNLVGVTIAGDLIEGNTIVADKLVIKGEDGLYYKLNTNGITTSTEQTDYNSLNGAVIRAKSVTAEKIKVTDLVAFDATIGGFNITDDSLYSGVKESVDNTTTGLYFGKDGQVAIGDANSFIKYYKDTDGNFKLAISASSITFGGNKTFEEAVSDEVKDSISYNMLAGQNLLSDTPVDWVYKKIDIGVIFHVPTSDLVDRFKLKDGDPLVYSVYLKSNGDKNLTAGWLLTDGTYELGDFNKSSTIISPGTDGRVVLSGITFDSNYEYLALAILNVDYQTSSPRLFLANLADPTETPTEAYRRMMLETGNEPSEWSPRAIDTAISVNNAQMDIDTINATLRTLVTGSNGETLMTQTDTGWTFNISTIQDSIGALSGNVADLNVDSEATKNNIDILKQSVADLGVYTEYIKFGVDNGQPCIILGELDSDFKVMITNTDIRFMEGSVPVASISNQALNIRTAVIEDELQQGDFAWVARSNGHYSLIWKG